MESCKGCLFKSVALSDFVALYEDATPENEKPKKHFCQMYLEGIPERILAGAEECRKKVADDEKRKY